MSERLLDHDALAPLGPEIVGTLSAWLSFERYAPGAPIVAEGEPADALFFILSGRARVQRRGLQLAVLPAGACFGELGLITRRPRAATVEAVSEVELARLSRARFEEMEVEAPTVALCVMRAVIAHLGDRLVELSDTVAALIEQRDAPKPLEIDVRVGGELRHVEPGRPLGQLLPAQTAAGTVVAGVVDGLETGLNTPLLTPCSVEPIVREEVAGRRIYRRSVDLILLEAARRVCPTRRVTVGPSLGFAHSLDVEGWHALDAAARRELAARLHRAAAELITLDRDIRVDRWTVPEATQQFERQGWGHVCHLLRSWRNHVVELVSCGELRALSLHPLLPRTGMVAPPELLVSGDELLVYYGDSEKRSGELVQAVHPAHLAREHERWLDALGAGSVGEYNALCIAGRVAEIIRISEGFHEKRVSRIADAIAAREAEPEGPVRVICIAGPSASGKTTFIKRLQVQLAVGGLRPRVLSLDDYYVDRERTPQTPAGELDFEAFEALDLPLLRDHLARLLRGEAVQSARFDFVTGLSHPQGGPLLQLTPGDVLLVEGIHGLHPDLPLPEGIEPFRVFINPMSALPLDGLTRVGISDLRLLRRVIRDRRRRNISVAENIARWSAIRAAERQHIFPHQPRAHATFNTSLIYEPSVIKVFAERYLLEVPREHPTYPTADRLRRLIDYFVAIYPDHVPPNSLIREFIGGSGFEQWN